MPDGSLRDTCVYSIILAEWPAVRNNLTFRLSTAAEADVGGDAAASRIADSPLPRCGVDAGVAGSGLLRWS